MKALPYLKFAQEHNVLQDPIMQPGTGRAMSPLGSGAWGAGLGALGGLGWAGVSHLRRKLQGEEGLDAHDVMKRVLIGSAGGAGLLALGALAANQRTQGVRNGVTFGDAALDAEKHQLSQQYNREHPGMPVTGRPEALVKQQSCKYAALRHVAGVKTAWKIPFWSPAATKWVGRVGAGIGALTGVSQAARGLGAYEGFKQDMPNVARDQLHAGLIGGGSSLAAIPMEIYGGPAGVAAGTALQGAGAGYAERMLSDPIPMTPARLAYAKETQDMKDALQQRPGYRHADPAAAPTSGISKGLMLAGGAAAGGLGLYALIHHLRQKKQQEKAAQSVFDQAPGTPTINDLMQAIQGDSSLGQAQKSSLLGQVASAAGGTPGNTPLSQLMHMGMGGVIGWLMSKYFGAGPVGQVMGALAGMGVGSMWGRHTPGVHPGYVNMWETS